MELQGTFHNGVIVVDHPEILREGAEVTVIVKDDAGREPTLTPAQYVETVDDLPADMARNHDHYIHGRRSDETSLRRLILFFRLLIDRDAAHDQAVQTARDFQGRIVTTEWVLTELADGLAIRRSNSLSRLCADLKASRFVKVVDHSSELYSAGLDLYTDRTDKK